MVEICLATEREARESGPCCNSCFLSFLHCIPCLHLLNHFIASVLLPYYLHHQRIWPVTASRMGVTGEKSICDCKDYVLSTVVGGCIMKHKTNALTQILRHTKVCDTGALRKARQCLSGAYYLGFSFSPNESEPLPMESLRYL